MQFFVRRVRVRDQSSVVAEHFPVLHQGAAAVYGHDAIAVDCDRSGRLAAQRLRARSDAVVDRERVGRTVRKIEVHERVLRILPDRQRIPVGG